MRHYTVTEPALLDPPAPISVHLLRLDLAQVDLTTELALGDRQGRGTVLSAALRRRAIAAVNAGFFSLNNGDPIGPLRVDGELVSDGSLGRGAAALIPTAGGSRLALRPGRRRRRGGDRARRRASPSTASTRPERSAR